MDLEQEPEIIQAPSKPLQRRGQNQARNNDSHKEGRQSWKEVKERPIEVTSHFNKQEDKPPNSNIFDQYAYSNDVSIDNTKGKDINTFKMGVTKLIEDVHRKKKEKKPQEPGTKNKKMQAHKKNNSSN